MKYTLRRATESDYDFCYGVTRENMYELFCRHWGGWVDAEFKKGLDLNRTRVILVCGEPAGYIGAGIREGAVYIDNIQMSSKHQGKGIGRAVLLCLADENSSRPMRLTTFVDNPAKRLYERLGFAVLSQEANSLLMERQPNQAMRSDRPSPDR